MTVIKTLLQAPIVQQLYTKLMKRRYRYLTDYVEMTRAKNIMEIGTFDGVHGLAMIKAAQQHHKQVAYYGFDLFETMTDKLLITEEAKVPLSQKNLHRKLASTGAEIRLFKGDTKKTLPKQVKHLPKMDLIFIDGGHSLETIKNDWHYVQQLMKHDTVVLFDDYWNRDDAGCKATVDSIDRQKYRVKVLPITDIFPKKDGILTIKIVKVTRK